MKYSCLTILFLCLSFFCSANYQDPFSEEDESTENELYLPIQPKRGYPAIVPFVKTELSLVSIHSPTIENPPTPLSEMPKVRKVDPSLPHTKLEDEIYDITKWFPLHQMRAPNEKEADDQRWVYYNKSSGYVIAYADHFLQGSVYDYIDGSIEQSMLRIRLNLIYLVTDEKVSMDLKTIQQAPHKVIFKSSSVSRMYEKHHQRIGEVDLESLIMEVNGRKAFRLELAYYKENRLQINTAVSFPVSQWTIMGCGISEAGKRKVMAVKVDRVNQNGETVHLQNSREEFIKKKRPNSLDSTFEDSSVKYHQLHPVPPDVIQLLSYDDRDDAFGDSDPFEDDTNFSKETVSVSELLSNQGVKSEAYFIPTSGYILAYTNASSQEELEYLFATLGGDRPLGLKCELNFYQIDDHRKSENEEWSTVDLLAATPIKLASIGSANQNGERGEYYSGESACKFELIQDETGENVDCHLDLKLDLPLFKLEKNYEGNIKIDNPKVVSLGINPKTNRMIMMLVRVSKIEGKKGQQR